MVGLDEGRMHIEQQLLYYQGPVLERKMNKKMRVGHSSTSCWWWCDSHEEEVVTRVEAVPEGRYEVSGHKTVACARRTRERMN